MQTLSPVLVHATLSTIAVLNGILILVTATINSYSLGALLFAWGVCAAVFSIFLFFAVFVLKSVQRATRPHADDLEAAQHLLTHAVSPVRYSEPFHHAPTWTRERLPAYCTPVEALNIYSEGISSTVCQSVPATVAVVVESYEDDCTFATSPFTSPPIYTMEIFVSREQVVFHDDATSVDSYVSDFEFDMDADDEADPEPAREHPTRAVSRHEISKLLQLCELAIMESNNELL